MNLQEFKEKSLLISELLDVEDVIAQLLVTDGYTTIDSIASETIENIEKIEGFDNVIVNNYLGVTPNGTPISGSSTLLSIYGQNNVVGELGRGNVIANSPNYIYRSLLIIYLAWRHAKS